VYVIPELIEIYIRRLQHVTVSAHLHTKGGRIVYKHKLSKYLSSYTIVIPFTQLFAVLNLMVTSKKIFYMA
jgi:hypothetical protein